MWRSSMVHGLPAGIAPPGASLRDGYFRINDPLPGLYYYAIELLPLAIKKVFRWMAEKVKTPARALQSAGKKQTKLQAESSNVDF